MKKLSTNLMILLLCLGTGVHAAPVTHDSQSVSPTKGGKKSHRVQTSFLFLIATQAVPVGTAVVGVLVGAAVVRHAMKKKKLRARAEKEYDRRHRSDRHYNENNNGNNNGNNLENLYYNANYYGNYNGNYSGN
jgi:hypothetical protein